MLKRLFVVGLTSCLGLIGITTKAASVPDYRGKAILVVDQTLNSDTSISNKLVRLTGDLVGDGWRVIRHDVERGKDPATQNADWQKQVRGLRATIKADYNSSPSEVKAVILVGHVAVPYAGDGIAIVGGHPEWQGAHAADPFYGELTTPYGTSASWVNTMWTDSVAHFTPNFPNTVGDGRFDQNILPSVMEVSVGRIDFYNMPAFALSGETASQTELRLISQYLDKDHDFRVGNFLVQPRAIQAGKENYGAVTRCSDDHFLDAVFGEVNVRKNCDCLCIHWFPDVDGVGEDYLVGFMKGPSEYNYSEGIGAVHPNDLPDYCAVDSNGTDPSDPSDDNAWVTRSSRVVFLNMYGSYFGEYDYQNNFMRAALANRYDPANGYHGYGLTAVWSIAGMDEQSLDTMAMGATIGETVADAISQRRSGALNATVNNGLLGDPTLRWHVVRPPTALPATKTTSTATLNWTHSPDATSYRIFRAPTSKGPWTLVASVGYVTTYAAARPTSGNPDNFYMVRAVKSETTLAGNYDNMSVGATVKLPGTNPGYFAIQSNPANVKVRLGDPASFSVEALGINALGNEKITYQWYKNGNAIAANDPNVRGGTTNSIVIPAVQSSDVANYHVTASCGAQTLLSSVVTITTKSPPIAVNDVFTVTRNTPTVLNMLANDSDPDDPLASLVFSVDPSDLIALNNVYDVDFGTFSVVGQTLVYTPSRTYIGSDIVDFKYGISDGAGAAGALFSINVVPHSPNQYPTVSTFNAQNISALSSVAIPFTVGDADYTAPGDLIVTATCSGALLDVSNLKIIGTGANRTLNLKAGARTGTETVTITVQDEDGGVTPRTFSVTVVPLQVPTMYPNGFSGNNYQFSLYGPAGASMEVKRSDDLVSWTSLGSVTLGANNSYSFSDVNAGSQSKRFYSATRTGYGCAANPIGFVKGTIPAASCPSLPIRAHIANPFYDPLETSALTVLSPNYDTFFSRWDGALQNYYECGTSFANSYCAKQPLDPGYGVLVGNRSSSSKNVIFSGEIPIGSQSVTLTPGFSLVGSRDLRTLLLGQLGLPAAVEDEIYQFDVATQQYIRSVYDGAQWVDYYTGSAVLRYVHAGEAFFYLNQGASPKTWTQTVTVCP